MPRQRVTMSPAEVDAFLAHKGIAVVGTRGADGAPDGEPAPFTWDGGEMRFTVAAGGPLHRNLLADARVVCSVEEFPSYFGIKGVTGHGEAVAVAESPRGVTFRIAAPRIESFDFAKMRRA